MSRVFLMMAVPVALVASAIAGPARPQGVPLNQCPSGVTHSSCEQFEAAQDAAAEDQAWREANMVRLKKAFGALAYSEQNSSWYVADYLPSTAKAKESALGSCRQKSGGGCQVMLSYSNQCAAVARAKAPGEDSANTGGTLAEAEANALKSCRADWNGASCKVLLSSCSHHKQVKVNP